MKILPLFQDTAYNQPGDIKKKTSKKPSMNNNENTVGAVYERSLKKDDTRLKSISNMSISIKQAELKTQNLSILLEQNFNRQAHLSNILKRPESFIPIKEITQEEASELVSENGYFGVKETSKRLFEFALSLSGGDYQQMGVMKEAIIKGFQKAATQWGGDLPEISNLTFDAIMDKFDNWFAEFRK